MFRSAWMLSLAALARSELTDFGGRAALIADTVATCHFLPLIGLFDDLVWQSGSTLETLSDIAALAHDGAAAFPPGWMPPPRWSEVVDTMFVKTPVIVDNCYDDHQWFLLGWVRAYEAFGNASFVQRAAAIFDFIASNGWSTSTCGGGVTWCPVSGKNLPYKNAITTELFISSAMALAPYEGTVGKAPGFFVGWAKTAWAWLEGSGILNQDGLFNDGLDENTCTNNHQTTWTYNQGVILSGLARLAAATQNATLAGVAATVARAAMNGLVVDGVLTEPCPGGSCGGDGQIFKGIFARHLGYLGALNSTDPSLRGDISNFFAAQAAALSSRSCSGGGLVTVGQYGFRWDGPCDVVDTATNIAALDLFTAAAKVGAPQTAPSSWSPLGLGNCADASGESMANCGSTSIIDERACRDAAWTTPGSVGYDFSLSDCKGGLFCRVRTLAGPSACVGGWTWTNGTAIDITKTNDSERTICVRRNSK
jgi:hypothetical protein